MALNKLIQQFASDPSWIDERSICFFIDNSVSELLKWSKDSDLSSLNIFALEEISLWRETIAELRPKVLIVWCNVIDNDIMDVIESASSVTSNDLEDIHIVVSSSPDATALHFPNLAEKQVYPYNYIVNRLQTYGKCNIYHIPIHTISLCQDANESLDIRILASHKHRHSKPVTLCGLQKMNINTSQYKTVYDIKAADMSIEIKTDLKLLAHSLAESIVYELGFDPTSTLFAVGKTATLVGHTVMATLPTLLENRSSNSSNLKLLDQLRFQSTRNNKTSDPIQPASVILVDRLEDLFTPSVNASDQCLLHRVLNTCKVISEDKNPSLDVNITPKWFEHLSQEDSLGMLVRPMSGVESLSYQAIPSLCYVSHIESQCFEHTNTNPNLFFDLMTSNEEVGRNVLSNELKVRISAEKGQLPPPKKRGIGAEILAMTQSLVKSPGNTSNTSTNGDMNIKTCLRSQGLIGLSLCIIEAMQRSSAKQFQQICDWKASLDVRMARESELMKAYEEYDDIEICMSTILNYFLAMKSPSKPKDTDGPIDLSHVLLQTIGLISLFRFKDLNVQFIEELKLAICNYLLTISDVELKYLHRIGLIHQALFDHIVSKNHTFNTSATQEYVKEMLQPLQELCLMYQKSTERLEKRLSAAEHSIQEFRNKVDFKSKGLIVHMLEECLQYSISNQRSVVSYLWEHIESPLQQLTRTGLGFISKGLGSLGFSNSNTLNPDSPHPGLNNTIVIAVIGGITYKEIMQVKQLLENQKLTVRTKGFKIVLISTNTISSGEIVSIVAEPFC